MALFRMVIAAGALCVIAPQIPRAVIDGALGLKAPVPSLDAGAGAEAALRFCTNYPKRCARLLALAEEAQSALRGSQPAEAPPAHRPPHAAALRDVVRPLPPVRPSNMDRHS